MLPQSEDLEQGVAYTTLCPLTAGEQVTRVLSLPPSLEAGYLAAITELGEVKRLRMEDLPGMSAPGDPDAAMDGLRRQALRQQAAARHAHDAAGARLHGAHLVLAGMIERG